CRPHAHLLSVGGVLLVQPVRHSDLATDLRDDAQMVEMFDDKLRRHAAPDSFPSWKGAALLAPGSHPTQFPSSRSTQTAECGPRDSHQAQVWPRLPPTSPPPHLPTSPVSPADAGHRAMICATTGLATVQAELRCGRSIEACCLT